MLARKIRNVATFLLNLGDADETDLQIFQSSIALADEKSFLSQKLGLKFSYVHTLDTSYWVTLDSRLAGSILCHAVMVPRVCIIFVGEELLKVMQMD